ncbi:hypothetical protein L1887_48575 [Cichorium endivia]|nr:hypothetical protein L1887_48575 [Cichorium endivia]
MQTAYSATLQATQNQATFAFVQRVKILAKEEQTHAAIRDLVNSLNTLVSSFKPTEHGDTGRSSVIELQGTDADGRTVRIDRDAYAKACLLRARLQDSTFRYTANEILDRYKEAAKEQHDSEKMWYHLGHFPRHARGPASEHGDAALQRVPSLPAIGSGGHQVLLPHPAEGADHLDGYGRRRSDPQLPQEGAHRRCRAGAKVRRVCAAQHLMKRYSRKLKPFQWLAVFPQLVARIVQKNEDAWMVLQDMILQVLLAYPQQSMWSMVAGASSKDAERKRRYNEIIQRLGSKGGASHKEVVKVVAFVATTGQGAAAAVRLQREQERDGAEHGQALSPACSRRGQDAHGRGAHLAGCTDDREDLPGQGAGQVPSRLPRVVPGDVSGSDGVAAGALGVCADGGGHVDALRDSGAGAVPADAEHGGCDGCDGMRRGVPQERRDHDEHPARQPRLADERARGHGARSAGRVERTGGAASEQNTRRRNGKTPRVVEARRALDPVAHKLDGRIYRLGSREPTPPYTTNNLVDALIKEATEFGEPSQDVHRLEQLAVARTHAHANQLVASSDRDSSSDTADDRGKKRGEGRIDGACFDRDAARSFTFAEMSGCELRCRSVNMWTSIALCRAWRARGMAKHGEREI